MVKSVLCCGLLLQADHTLAFGKKSWEEKQIARYVGWGKQEANKWRKQQSQTHRHEDKAHGRNIHPIACQLDLDRGFKKHQKSELWKDFSQQPTPTNKPFGELLIHNNQPNKPFGERLIPNNQPNKLFGEFLALAALLSPFRSTAGTPDDLANSSVVGMPMTANISEPKRGRLWRWLHLTFGATSSRVFQKHFAITKTHKHQKHSAIYFAKTFPTNPVKKQRTTWCCEGWERTIPWRRPCTIHSFFRVLRQVLASRADPWGGGTWKTTTFKQNVHSFIKPRFPNQAVAPLLLVVGFERISRVWQVQSKIVGVSTLCFLKWWNHLAKQWFGLPFTEPKKTQFNNGSSETISLALMK